MSSLISWSKSECKEGWLHRFKILEEHEDGVKEICLICHKEVVFKMIGGKIDNLEYLKYHLRDALDKRHPLFKREYHGN